MPWFLSWGTWVRGGEGEEKEGRRKGGRGGEREGRKEEGREEREGRREG